MTLILRVISAVLTTLFLASVSVAQSDVTRLESGALNYDIWEVTASVADDVVARGTAATDALEDFRETLLDWRDAFLDAQSTNAARITTLRGQIDALGAEPADGEPPELPEIANRRAELQEELARALVPVRRAEEAFLQADGLIEQLDAMVRERQTDRFLELKPTPLNPANWPTAITEFSDLLGKGGNELQSNLNQPSKLATFQNNLPVILVLLVIGIVLIWRSTAWIDTALAYIRAQDGAKGGAGHARFRVGVFLVSLVAMVLPILGLTALIQAVDRSQLLGDTGGIFLDILSGLVVVVFASRWLARQLFPPAYPPRAMISLPPDQLRRARFNTVMLAVFAGVLMALSTLGDRDLLGDTTRAVLGLPFIILAGLMMWRLGRMILQAARKIEQVVSSPETGPSTSTHGEATFRILPQLLARAVIAIAIFGPLLAAIGYTLAGTGFVTSTVLTLGLVGMLLVLMRLVRDIYALFVGDEASEEGLIPVLLSFALVLAGLPILALIWGARIVDLREAWSWISTGFQIGDTRISPTDFLTFAVLFTLGYLATRLAQGALKTQVLPKTNMDTGGRNAVVSGVGYIGIFIAALIAITATGIDLSSLAIVAGALSVGVGFGLQTIVSNFVSGIILLIERPISEGDWIEVSGTMGVVRDISVRATRIETFDRRDVIVPNADLISTAVTNWTKGNLSGRIIVNIGVAYGTDTRKVEQILSEIASAQPIVMLNPPPAVIFTGFGADSLDFEIRAMLRDVNFSLSTASDIRHEIAARFAQEGIEIPFAQRDVWLRNPEALTQEPEDDGAAISDRPLFE